MFRKYLLQHNCSLQQLRDEILVCMGILFELNGKEVSLATAEAKAFSYGWNWWVHKEEPDGQLLFLSRERVRMHKFSKAKLGLTHRIIKVLATCAPKEKDIQKAIESIPWKLHIKKRTYRVSLSGKLSENSSGKPLEKSFGAIEKTSLSEREVAKIVWQLAGKNIDLSNPQVIVDVVIGKKQAYIGLRMWTQDEAFQNRRAHLLPAMHPSMMHPTIARAITNISCAKKIHDPFCGAGGLLLEANLAGVHASGADIDQEMLKRARQNCAAFGLRPSLRISDAIMWQPRVQAIVTDMPYGKNTRPVALQHLFEAFLIRAGQSTSRAIIGLPCTLHVPKGWMLRAHLSSYVHNSMTKHFFVLEKA